jgi:hypothetical protein
MSMCPVSSGKVYELTGEYFVGLVNTEGKIEKGVSSPLYPTFTEDEPTSTTPTGSIILEIS